MKSIINKNKLIIAIAAIATAGFSIFYAAAGIFKPNAPAENNLTSGLVGYWTFDGQDTNWGANTTRDKSINGYNGTMVNMSTSTSPVPGVIGQALSFNGVNSYVDATGFVQWYLRPLSYGAWVKLNATPTGDRYVIYKSGEFYLRIGATSVGCKEDNSGQIETAKTIVLVPGQWYHIFCSIKTAGDSTHKIYINGADSSAVAGGMSASPYGESLKIGGEPFLGYLNGQIDEVRIYNKTLSDSEVMELYNQGAKRLAVINKNQKTDIVPSGLIHYYTFDGPDMSGDTVIDKVSSGAINGTLSNCNVDTSKPNLTIGKIGQGVNIINNSEDNCITLVSSIVTGTTFSMSMWMRPDYDSSGFLFGQGNQTSIRYGGSGLINYQFSGSPHTSNSNLISVGSWNHIVVAVNSGTATFYVNGTADGTALNVISMNAARIGGAGGQGSFYGKIDEVRVYNRAITQSEVTELYNQGAKDLLKVNMPQTDLIPQGLVGYWTFNGQDTNWGANTINDLSGNNNTGIMTNMSTSTSPVAGISGQALKFDGSNDYVIKTSATGLSQGNNPFTMSAWIKTTSTNKAFISWGSVPNEFLVSSSPRRLWHAFDWSNGLTANTVLSDNTWYHAAVTYNGSARKIYLNGSLDGADNPSAFAVSGTNLNIGQEYYNENFFTGSIDEVRIYNRALSAGEVMELYRAGGGL